MLALANFASYMLHRAVSPTSMVDHWLKREAVKLNIQLTGTPMAKKESPDWSSNAESENRAEPGQCPEPEFSFNKLNLAKYNAPSDIEIIFDFEHDSDKLYPADGEYVPDKVYPPDVENKTEIHFPLKLKYRSANAGGA
jgi:hypothetical protein